MSNEIAVYGKFKKQLADFKAADAELSFDTGTPEGYADCKDYYGKLREVRNRTDDLRLDTTKGLRGKVKAINNEGNEIIAEVDAIAAPYKAQLDAEDAKEQKLIDDQVEKNRLQAEKDDNEREAYIDNQAFDNAKLAADLKAQKDALDKEKADIEAAKVAEDAKVKAVAETKLQAAQDAKDAAEEAERNQKAAVAEVERKAKEKADAETKRIEDEKAAEIVEEKRLAKVEADRVADVEHRVNIEKETLKFISELIGDNDHAIAILYALEQDLIPNVTINY